MLNQINLAYATAWQWEASVVLDEDARRKNQACGHLPGHLDI
jgi:hypothetical protein